MIITALANLIYNFLNVLMVFNLPALPDSVMTVFNNGMSYVFTGVRIIAVFTGNTALGVLALLLQLLLLMHSAYMLFSFISFIIRKIPMLNVHM